jgi:hypothetical protein
MNWFIAGQCISQSFSGVTACSYSGAVLNSVCFSAAEFKISLLETAAGNFTAQKPSVSKPSARRATKLLPLRPCKATVVHALKEHHPAVRINFCNWFLQPVYDGEVDPQLAFFF